MKTPNPSTGPRSAAGKARSSLNALKSGIYSKSLVIPGENSAQLDTLKDEYYQRYRPVLPEQRDLVDILVRSTWTLRRLAAAEAQVWIFEMEQTLRVNLTAPLGHMFHDCDRTLTRLDRIVNSTQRNFRDALRELEHLQSLEIAPEPPPAPALALVPNHAVPKPIPRPVSEPAPQPVKPEPVTPSKEFVSSTSAPPPPATPKTAPQPVEKPLPFHQPGNRCRFIPIGTTKYRRCPHCFPNDCLADPA